MQERETKRLPNPDAVGWADDGFSADLGHGDDLVDQGDATEETRGLANHEPLPSGLDEADRANVVILRPGTRLRQGSVYLDLDDAAGRPFTAMGGEEAAPDRRLVPKHRVGYDLWNRLVGRERRGDDAG